MSHMKYPTHNENDVWQDVQAVGYLTSTLKALTWAVREQLNTPEAVAVHGFEQLRVDAEAPIDVESYPFVQVLYRNDSFNPSLLANSEYYKPEPGSDVIDEVVPYMFTGTATVNVYSTSILERERISDCLIGQLGASLEFRKRLISNPWVNIHPNMKTLASATANESWGTPWSDDLMTCFRSFTFKVQGEFFYRVEPDLTYLEKIVSKPEPVIRAVTVSEGRN